MNSSFSCASVSFPSGLLGDAAKEFVCEDADLLSPGEFLNHLNNPTTMEGEMNDVQLEQAMDAACSDLLQEVEKRQLEKQKICIISDVVVKEAPSKLKRLLNTERSAVTRDKRLFYEAAKPSTSAAVTDNVPQCTSSVTSMPPPPVEVQPAATTSTMEQQQSSSRPISPVLPRRKTLKRKNRQDGGATIPVKGKKKVAVQAEEPAPEWLLGFDEEDRGVMAAAYKVKDGLIKIKIPEKKLCARM